jgi:hypothetical protein
MTFYPNIPAFQRFTQQLADGFNKDEILWQKLENCRKRRRKKMNISEEIYKTLDNIEFESMRQLDDYIGTRY